MTDAREEDTAGTGSTIFDGFEGFQIPGLDETNNALLSGLVALDANALLNFYRYNEQTREDLLAVLNRLGARLWIPHQVMLEFWRRRLNALGNPATAASQARETLGKSRRSAGDAINQWAKHVALDDRIKLDLHQRLDQTYQAIYDVIDEGAPGQVDPLTATHEDAIIAALSACFEGKVGSPLDEAAWSEAVAEGQRRADALEPPGYMDADKADSQLPEGPAGDYLVWVQATTEAVRRGQDVVLVTGDEKDDWWWRHRGHLLGARPELVSEYKALSGKRLFLLTPRELLARSAVLDVTVAQESLEDASRSRTAVADRAAWTLEGVAALLRRLEAEGREQAEVIRTAASLGGVIDRETLYDVCQYADDRMLRGFTRPTARITSDLQFEGIVDEGVTPMLTTVYQGGVLAKAFRIPAEVVDMLSGRDSDGE